VLFQGRYDHSDEGHDYDVAPGGRFLMLRTPEESFPREIHI
jgi:hypothetical protein